MIARLFVCALLVGTFGIANAQSAPAASQQQPAAKQLSPEQRAAIQKRNQAIVSYASQILKQVDNGQYTQVWDGMSEVGKKAVGRDAFAKAVEQQREPLGQAKSRKIAAVYGRNSDGHQDLPAGTYVNVRYLTQFTDAAKPMAELVSFHLDSDRKWRLSGYTLRNQSATPAQANGKQ